MEIRASNHIPYQLFISARSLSSTATAQGTRRVRARRSPRSPVVEQIVPNSEWTEDNSWHYLLVDLPGFRKEEVKLQVDRSGRIIAKGERQVNDYKQVRFELAFPVPMNSDIDKIAGKFYCEILHVIVSKQTLKYNKESETKKANGNGRCENEHEFHREEEEIRNENAYIRCFTEELTRNWEQELGILSSVQVLSKNRGILVTAVLAFSFGFLVSAEFQF